MLGDGMAGVVRGFGQNLFPRSLVAAFLTLPIVFPQENDEPIEVIAPANQLATGRNLPQPASLAALYRRWPERM